VAPCENIEVDDAKRRHEGDDHADEDPEEQAFDEVYRRLQRLLLRLRKKLKGFVGREERRRMEKVEGPGAGTVGIDEDF
jgi:hypothetical protein